MMTNIEILTECFNALSKSDRERLKYHLDNNTSIFCGPGSEYDYYKDDAA